MANRREHYTQGFALVPGCSQVGYLAFTEADGAGLGAHDHEQAFELCLIARGRVDWWVEDEVWEVGAEQVYLTRSFERHGAIDARLQPCELFWAVFRFDGRARLGGLAREEADALAARFAALRSRTFAADTRLIDAFKRLRDAHRAGPGTMPRLAARLAFGELLLATLRCHDTAAEHARAVSPAVRKAMAWMTRHLGEDFAMDDAAAVAGLSITRFHERFADEVALPPGEWRTRQRVREAKKLLRQTDRPVTDIAMRCGFTTSQYFATVFRKQTGWTPRAYRAGGAGDAPVQPRRERRG